MREFEPHALTRVRLSAEMLMARASNQHIDQVLAVVDGQTKPPTDGVVWKSWMRSANIHGLDPGSRESPRILTISELRNSQEAASQLVEVARVELDHLYKIVRPARYVSSLGDKDGLVIEHRGEEGDAMLEIAWPDGNLAILRTERRDCASCIEKNGAPGEKAYGSEPPPPNHPN
jgi:hypothetical protein